IAEDWSIHERCKCPAELGCFNARPGQRASCCRNDASGQFDIKISTSPRRCRVLETYDPKKDQKRQRRWLSRRLAQGRRRTWTAISGSVATTIAGIDPPQHIARVS